MTPVQIINQMMTIAAAQSNPGTIFGTNKENEGAYTWSRRLWELERLTDPTGAKQRHVDRMKKLEAIVLNPNDDSTPLDKLAASYYRAEAESIP